MIQSKWTTSTTLILFFITTILILNSCNDDDGYSLGNYKISMATVTPLDIQNNSFFLTLDNGETLWPAASNVSYKPQYNQRVIVDYTILSDSADNYTHYIKINGLRLVLTKRIIDLTPANEKEIGNDPIGIISYWIGDHYLNIRTEYNIGGEKIHSLNLVQNKLSNSINTNSTDSVNLEFRHNAFEDPIRYKEKNYISFYLKPLQIENKDSINIFVKVLDLDSQIKEYKIVYKYNETTKENNAIANDISNNTNIQ